MTITMTVSLFVSFRFLCVSQSYLYHSLAHYLRRQQNFSSCLHFIFLIWKNNNLKNKIIHRSLPGQTSDEHRNLSEPHQNLNKLKHLHFTLQSLDRLSELPFMLIKFVMSFYNIFIKEITNFINQKTKFSTTILFAISIRSLPQHLYHDLIKITAKLRINRIHKYIYTLSNERRFVAIKQVSHRSTRSPPNRTAK